MHAEAMDFGRRMLAEMVDDYKQVLEIGSRDINGSLRGLLPGVPYVGVDLLDGPGVDVVADILIFQPVKPPDLIICTEVLEHTSDWQQIIDVAGHFLADGGHLLVTCATDPRAPHSALDGGALRADEYYANVSPEDLEDQIHASGLVVLKSEVYTDRGDLYILAGKMS